MLDLINKIQYCYTYTAEQISLGLLLYSHIPTALISLFFGAYVYIKRRNYTSLALFTVCLSFASWCLLDLISWFSFVGSRNVMFAWSLLDLIALFIFFSAYYLLYYFIKEKDLPLWQKLISILLILPTGLSTFFGYNLSLYDSNVCAAIENDSITRYPYFVEGIFILAVIVLIIFSYKRIVVEQKRNEVLLVGGGIFSLLLFFFSSTLLVNILAESDSSLYVYNYEIYGLFGMPVLLGFLAFVIVRYKTFNIKTFGVQVLIFALLALIGSQFFYIDSLASIIITSITLIITGVIGINLMRSVKKEIQAKEQIQKLADDLSKANARLKELDQQKSEFISLASHQIRGPLASIKGYVSMILEGDFGKISKGLKETMETIFSSTQSLVVLVGDFLDVSRIEQGRMKYDFTDFNLEELAKTAVREIEPTVAIKNLKISFIPEEKADYIVHADQGKIKQIILNIIDNSVKYTKEGGVEIGIERKNNKIHLFVKDTGVGIAPEVLPKLFEKFTRAPDASKTNILGTGLGLYVAKKMIEAQDGRVWAESSGVGKGSIFHIELNAKNRDTESELPQSVKKFAKDL